ncbi:MAG: MarC family protein [Candidatus Thermoplasmatota archaeon]|nr:MarC family protein [Candidatus Thermoplasmatota archaeon]MCL5793869.1 MarC family protein [Candidatus Thermoplasmatota archaeon]
MDYLIFFLTVFAAIFSILNPVGAVPILVSLTEGYTVKERDAVIRISVAVAGGMILGFMFLGTYIFQIFGIDIYDFQIAGGVLVFKVAFDMLQGKTSNTKITTAEQEESRQRSAIGVAPIGTPLLAGPGSITTAIIYFNERSGFLTDKLLVIVAILLVLFLSFLVLRYSLGIFKRIGNTGSLIISRIMGLLIASVGVGFIVEGIAGVITLL